MNRVQNSRRALARPVESSSFEICLEQAEICCQQARVAVRQRRYQSACGLFATAATLYKRATMLDGVSYHAIEQRLNEIEREIMACSELDKGVAYPLYKATLKDSILPA